MLYRTLTTPVELRTCLQSIKSHAFTASEYPVVVTLEDHLTTDLQAKVAEVIIVSGLSLSCVNDDLDFIIVNLNIAKM